MKLKGFVIAAWAGLALASAAAVGSADARAGQAREVAVAGGPLSAGITDPEFSAQRKKAKSRKAAKSQKKKATKPKGGKGHLGHH